MRLNGWIEGFFVFIRSKGYLPNSLSNKQLNPTCEQIEENVRKIYSDLAQGEALTNLT